MLVDLLHRHTMARRDSTVHHATRETCSALISELRANTRTVLDESRRRAVTTHQVALDRAQVRVRQAMELRGRPAPAPDGTDGRSQQ
jgi:glutamate dehydrogenase (NAD(P)+)